ncbi:MAG: 3-deoxy-D-manno-octulosonic-acid transferase [Candidatus Azotimanducaceae bacterium]|jgi:3-deoxy-D-manno-octulosonic-acid transferase
MPIRWIYNLLLYFITPFILLRVAWRSLKEPDYKTKLMQRFGFVSESSKNPIWVHAVSAGETIAAVPLVKRLLAQGHSVLMSGMTPTGKDRAEVLLGDQIQYCYAPYDLPGSIKRFLRTVQPKALIIIDTELWPNMLHYSHQFGIPIYLVNARLSKKSAAGYLKYQRLSRPMMNTLRRVYAQSEKQGERFLTIGLNKSKLAVPGSIKFDAQLPKDFESRLNVLRKIFNNQFCFLAASTHPGEEEKILEAFAQISSDKKPILILAPRHTHRTVEVYKLCKNLGYTIQRHSEGKPFDSAIYLLDTMGELIYFYGLAGAAFVGGSLVDVGGHNPMEPGSLGVPMMMGMHTRNIDDIAEQFIEAGAMVRITDQASLNHTVSMLCSDDELRREMSAASISVMEKNKGALDIIESEIVENLR